MLEDDFTYVLKKALTGHGLTPSEAAVRAGLKEDQVLSFLGGDFDAATARCLAPVLGLDGDAFAGHASYHPAPLTLPEIVRLKLPFGADHVNAWLVRAGDRLVLFDAGFDADDLWQAIRAHGDRLPDLAFITHDHRDHTGGLRRLLDAGVPVYSASQPEAHSTGPGDEILCDPLAIRALDLSGHAQPALGFLIEGLSAPVLVAGDALFAGSIGGCATPAAYRLALATLHAALDGLTADTILLAGHGPPTTLAEEQRANPFLDPNGGSGY